MLITGQRTVRPHRPWVHRDWDETLNLSSIYYGDELVSEEAGKAPALGLAVDIGTTTLVVALLDLETGLELGTVGALNPQASLAHDVLSRIQIASEESGLLKLQGLLTAELRRMTLEVTARAGVDPCALREIVLSGNTAMLHLAAGVNPSSLGRYPYTPAIRGGTSLLASQLNLVGAPQARVYLPPVLDGFVGADITVGIWRRTCMNSPVSRFSSTWGPTVRWSLPWTVSSSPPQRQRPGLRGHEHHLWNARHGGSYRKVTSTAPGCA